MAHEKIWLQKDDDAEEYTWCQDKINDNDIEYVRADVGGQVEPPVRCDPSPCANSCEANAFYIEIRRLKSKMIKVAAELAKELHTDDITDGQDKRLYKLIQELKGN